MANIHIPVKYNDESSYSLKDGDDRLTCDHEYAEVEAPCCSTRGSSGHIECGCGGNYSVYCPDCDNEDLTDTEAETLIDAFIGEPEYDYAE